MYAGATGIDENKTFQYRLLNFLVISSPAMLVVFPPKVKLIQLKIIQSIFNTAREDCKL
jgi:branched-subunit amino acid permease